MTRLLADMLAADRLAGPGKAYVMATTLTAPAQAKGGVPSLTRFRSVMSKFLTAPETKCGQCLTHKHGWWNCPLLAVRVVDMFKQGTWGVKLTDTQLATV